MMRLLVLCLAITATVTAKAEETKLESKTESIGLFKNGLAIVRREIAAPGPGVYRIENLPQPIHGTFWVFSDAEVRVRATHREIEVEPKGDTNLQNDLAGREVTIFFREAALPPVTGRVVKRVRSETNSLTTPPNYNLYSSSYRFQQGPSQFLIVESKEGQTFVDRSTIAYVKASGSIKKVKRRQPVLLVTVKGDRGPSKIGISYLTRGVAWAPSYQVQLSKDDTLSVRQKAVIKNELEDLSGADVLLISGFPHIKFGHVTSPLSPTTTWANFFAQLNTAPQAQHASALNAISQQRVVVSNVGAPAAGGVDLSATPAGEGADLHYESVGRPELQKGDSLVVPVAEGRADFERIVEWIVADNRNAQGRYVNDYERRQNPEKYDDSPWDAVRFRNPLDFPMTTGPATITENGRFWGQTLSYWVNKGELTTLRVTKALSVRTVSSEQEVAGDRKIVYVAGNDFQRVNVLGELKLSNHRAETVKVVIRRRFSGDLTKADGDPKLTLREEGVYSVNRRNELAWAITMKPGEEKKLNYSYAVLVDR